MKQIAPINKRPIAILLFTFIAVFTFFVIRYQSLNKQISQDVPENFIINNPSTPIEAPLDNTTQSISKVLEKSTEFSFSGSDNYGSNGGVIVLSAKTPSTIKVENSKTTVGLGTFTLYKVTKSDLLNYLVYKVIEDNSWGNQIEKLYKFDTTSIPVDKTFQQQVTYNKDTYESNPINLPLEDIGIWFLRGEVNGGKSETMLIRTNLSGIIHKGDNENIFWIQDTNYTSVNDANIDLYNSNKKISKLESLNTDDRGLAVNDINSAIDFAIVSKDKDLTLIPVNLSNLNYNSARGYSSFSTREPNTRSFAFTDRFLYKPGDIAHFKAIIRKDDDADYSIETKTYQISFGTYENIIIEKNLELLPNGTINADIQIPADIEPGYYEILIKDRDDHISYTGLQVANFRKPDASITVTTDKLMYQPGESVILKFSGTAFLGQPLRNKEIRYKIYQYKAWIFGDYLNAKYNSQEENYFSKDLEIKQGTGTVALDKKGQAEIQLTALNNTGERQFWVIETEYLDSLSTTANSAIKTLINPGDFIIEPEVDNQDKVENTTIKNSYKLNQNIPGVNLNGHKITGTLLKKENDIDTKIIDGLTAVSDNNGKFKISFTAGLAGYYKLQLETKDKGGNLILLNQEFYISKTANNKYTEIFTITSDKENYKIGDKAKINIKTIPEIKNIFVSIGREYSKDVSVLNASNGLASFEFDILENHQPNIFVFTGTFLNESWKKSTLDIPVDTNDKKVFVSIDPSQKTFKPGETAQFDITAKDSNGNLIKTDMAFWVFDKALLELHNNSFDRVYENFWYKRSFSTSTNYSYQGISSNDGGGGGGGCFAGDTLITMSDGSKKRIDEVAKGDLIQTFRSTSTKEKAAAMVTGTHAVKVDGYMIINSSFKITPEHILFVNNKWIPAGEINIGDSLLKSDKTRLEVYSIEWIRGNFDVYNLAIENFHTFFANDIYVHNDKDNSRSQYKDTAYWNPNISTGEDGKASVTITLPDNLTTWVAAAITANDKTQVGTGQTEFIVTKDFVVRPIFPMFARTGDQLTLSALINNFSKNQDNFSVEAKLSGGDMSSSIQQIVVDTNDIQEIKFPTKITGMNENAIFNVKSQGQNNRNLIDNAIEKFPIYEYGSWQTQIDKKTDSASFSLNPTSGTDSKRLESSIELKASRYNEIDKILLPLVNNQYSGSIYDNAATLIAASLLKQNGKDLGIYFNQNELNQEVKTAIDSLKDNQDPNGYWINQTINTIDIDATIFILESISIARKAGYEIDQSFIDKTLSYIYKQNKSSAKIDLLQQYTLSLFPDKKQNSHALDITSSKDPEYISRALIANKRQGFDISKEAESRLPEIAYSTNNQLAWRGIYVKPNNSQKYIILGPTAWAVYASQQIGSKTIDIEKALDYLYRNPQSEPEIQALTLLTIIKYFQDTDQINPNYSYKVIADQKVLATGTVSSTQQQLKSVKVPASLFDSNSKIIIEKNGNGQLNSALVQKEFVIDKSHPAENNDLEITRKYLSTNINKKPIEIGDLIIVQLQIDGLGLGEDNVEIVDYLPAGLMAIDQSLDNGNFDDIPGQTDRTASHKITDQGIKLNFSTWNLSGTYVYKYKARVLSDGTFNVPPAVVKLNSDPSTWASTTAETFTVDGKNALDLNSVKIETTQVQQTNKIPNESTSVKQKVIYVLFIGTPILIIILLFILIRKKRTAKNK